MNSYQLIGHGPRKVICLHGWFGSASGWGPFVGAVDNIGWTINGQSQTANFEVPGGTVPEPGSLLLAGAALFGLAATRRRRS